MVQWALYLDETGVTDPHPLPLTQGYTPLFTIGGVALPLDRWREYDRKFLYLKREFFGAEIDRSKKIDTAWEAKGTDLFAPRNSGSERNRVFAYRVCEIVQEFGGKVFGVNFLKSVQSPMPKPSMYTKGLQILAERYDIFLREAGTTGLVILDSRMAHTKKGSGDDYTVAVSFLSFLFGNKDGQRMQRIVEAPMFADSGLTAGLQIADIMSGLLYTECYRDRLTRNKYASELCYLDYSHVAPIYEFGKVNIFLSQNKYGPRRMWGIRTIDHSGDVVTSGMIKSLAARFNGS